MRARQTDAARLLRERGIPHRRLGKLIVATDTGAKRHCWTTSRARARANGVDDLERLVRRASDGDAEPALQCTAALLSPSTGIVDSHALMLALQGDAENAGAQCVFHTPLLSGGVRAEGGFALQFGGQDGMALSCTTLVNAAGLHAPTLARRIGRAYRPPASRANTCARAATSRWRAARRSPG